MYKEESELCGNSDSHEAALALLDLSTTLEKTEHSQEKGNFDIKQLNKPQDKSMHSKFGLYFKHRHMGHDNNQDFQSFGKHFHHKMHYLNMQTKFTSPY